MIVELQQIYSLDEIDFDTLFSDSFTRIEQNFLWPAQNLTYEFKRDYYRRQLESGISGTWPLKNDSDRFIMIITKVDGIIAEFAAGFLSADRYLSLRWNLTSAATGNRNWRYTPEAQVARKQFMTLIGAIGVKEYTWVGSLLYKLHKQRSQLGGYTLVETPIIRDPDPHPNHKLVELTITFNP